MSAEHPDTASVLAEVARAAVAAQESLDERAATSAAGWDDTGIPPWAGAYAGVRAEVETKLGVAPRSAAGAPSRLLLLDDGGPPARIAFSVVLRPPERSESDA